MNQEIIFLNKKKIIISRRELVMLLVIIALSIKVMEIKIKHYHPKSQNHKIITKLKVNGKLN